MHSMRKLSEFEKMDMISYLFDLSLFNDTQLYHIRVYKRISALLYASNPIFYIK